MPAEYEQWAMESRAVVEQEVQNVLQSCTLELNAVAQALYMQLSQKGDALSQKVEAVMDTQHELLRLCQTGVSRPHVGAHPIGAVEETFDEEIPVDMDEEIPPSPVMHPMRSNAQYSAAFATLWLCH